MPIVNIWDTVYMFDYDRWVHELAENLARKERWDYVSDTAIKTYPILRNYINHTFRRTKELSASDMKYWYESSTHACFNTGLFTENFEPIYALLTANRGQSPWRLAGFFKESSHELKRISPLPLRATYFSDIKELFFDTRYELRVNTDHILTDETNRERIPRYFS